jgi:hypothetical protein
MRRVTSPALHFLCCKTASNAVICKIIEILLFFVNKTFYFYLIWWVVTREISTKGEGDGTAYATVNHLQRWLLDQ